MGGDCGSIIGTVHAIFLSEPAPVFETTNCHHYSQWIDNNTVCTNLSYTVYSKHIEQTFEMYITVYLSERFEVTSERDNLCKILKHEFNSRLPTLINITILPCPMGFEPSENPYKCDCYYLLSDDEVTCKINNGKSYFSWIGTLWINVTDTGFTRQVLSTILL